MPVCPVCSHSLLRHLDSKQVSWFCCNCRQEMPDLDAVNLLDTSKSLLEKIETKLSRTQTQISGYSFTSFPATLTLNELDSIDLTIVESQKRLNVVNLIINKTQSIVTHGIADLVSDYTESFEVETADLDRSIRVLCKDADTILWYVCYAILCRSSIVLDNHYLKTIYDIYRTADIAIERVVRLISLMKAYVLSLVKDELLDMREPMTQRFYKSLSAEITDYFELIINSLKLYH
jgi:hypothetical protein